MQDVTVTIGIPVYNGGAFLKQTITSVLKQSFTFFELIVTDDGSTDDTLEFLKSIDDPRLKIVSDGHNRGIAYRLNQQIDLAQGKYFFRMDADDLMFPYRVEKQVAYLESHLEVDVVGAQAVVIDENNGLLGKRAARASFYNNNDYFKCARFIHPTIAGKLEWFKRWRYSDDMSGNEDLDLWIRSHHESVFADMEEPLLFYRDPYKFRLKTYFYRQRRFLKCAWKLREYMDSPLFFLFCLIKGCISLIFAALLTFIGKEEKVIARRNMQLTEEEINKYKVIVTNIL